MKNFYFWSIEDSKLLNINIEVKGLMSLLCIHQTFFYLDE